MSDSTELEPMVDEEMEPLEVNPMVHLIAPVAAIVGTMVVRKLVGSAYQKATGRKAPDARDPRTPMVRAFVWTVVITSTTAIAEIVIYRAIQRIGEKEA
jgi:hypothetical protein